MNAKELYAIAVQDYRYFLAQDRWNDSRTFKARTAHWASVRAYAAKANLSFPEAMEAVKLGNEA